ncbi:flagellar basal body P-ring formation chaperone FlgA [Dyella tabacisoli]|uniref:Flagella basal body P-ring formation protein FlgA n=1 Tax=Dyella tabacisoli TaxID=2282381 RepID=A0A369URF9_9GAMM|nr:flagellar basal body P-ring formation chaperone FlgA [Dyella tabacisoli]RDD82635.1 flagella basal body P-ring formation protein FlgA [Dyella tabacisoli]
MNRLALALLSLLIWVQTASATQSPDSLRHAAENAVRERYDQPGNRLVVQTDSLDTRLQLPDCALPPQAIPPKQPASRLSVEVHCPVAGGWRVRVPVRLELYRQVLVTTRPLQRGDGIVMADLHSEERDVARLGYGYIEQPDQATGRVLARPLTAGSVLTPGALGGRQSVRAGDRVQLIARLDGIEVRASGLALGSGDAGARLRVRNDSSGKAVDAVVRDAGVVEALP